MAAIVWRTRHCCNNMGNKFTSHVRCGCDAWITLDQGVRATHALTKSGFLLVKLLSVLHCLRCQRGLVADQLPQYCQASAKPYSAGGQYDGDLWIYESVYIPKVNHHSEWCIRPVARAWQVELLITRPTHAATDHTRNISILAEATWTHERVNTPAWQQLKACICLGPHPRHNKSGAFHSTDPPLLTQSQDSGYTLFWWSVATNSHWSVRLVG